MTNGLENVSGDLGKNVSGHHRLASVNIFDEDDSLLGMSRDIKYKHCVQCGTVREGSHNGRIVLNGLKTLPSYLEPFYITSGFCSQDCIDNRGS